MWLQVGPAQTIPWLQQGVNTISKYLNSNTTATKPSNCPPIVHLQYGFMAYHYTTAVLVQRYCNHMLTSSPKRALLLCVAHPNYTQALLLQIMVLAQHTGRQWLATTTTQPLLLQCTHATLYQTTREYSRRWDERSVVIQYSSTAINIDKNGMQDLWCSSQSGCACQSPKSLTIKKPACAKCYGGS